MSRDCCVPLPRGATHFMTVVFPDHTHLPFNISGQGGASHARMAIPPYFVFELFDWILRRNLMQSVAFMH